jgi:hypothetical protein
MRERIAYRADELLALLAGAEPRGTNRGLTPFFTIFQSV